ncbi:MULTISPECIES: ubiquinone anaerobic biosynthesis protein UbiV [Thalassospira]|uniref:Ubiquinone biosynthesis protein UbiV n=2 Tax=Thalassospira TaxID=168934 RepID=A0A367WAT9_9PROT|nr:MULTISPECIES: U32 family peptidase [Thalassospira]MDG4720451.1 U32 family peptidase [Thalassospira sp. FZY0004]RCK37570.1 protease [Thalassospira profundimaris]
MTKSRLVMGPILFHWDEQRKHDFYAQVADEADIDIVHVGEVVCAKRMPFFDKHLPDVIERLQRAGKEVVLSTLALVMNGRESDQIKEITQMPDLLVEANDISAAGLLAGKPHVIGPYINIYNESTLSYFEDQGAKRISLPWELPMTSIARLCETRKSAEIEIQIFGRMPLAISARCYSARARGLHKDGCRYVCGDHIDGMDVATLDNAPFLAVNGLQTMSSHYVELSDSIEDLQNAGVNAFRLSPHSLDMTCVAQLYRQLLDRQISADELRQNLKNMSLPMAFSDGFLHGMAGAELRNTLGQGAE